MPDSGSTRPCGRVKSLTVTARASLMPKRLSATLFYLELALIAGPLTLLAGIGAAVLCVGDDMSDLLVKRVAMPIAFVGLYGLWGMSIAFAKGGVEAMGRVSRSVKTATAIGVLMTASSALYGYFPKARLFLELALCGIPFLIPLGHILTSVVIDQVSNRPTCQRRCKGRGKIGVRLGRLSMVALSYFILVPPAYSREEPEVVTLGITDFYYPFLSAIENQEVLKNIFDGARAVGTYKGSSRHFEWKTCMIGVTCLPIPHWESDNPQGDIVQLSVEKVFNSAKGINELKIHIPEPKNLVTMEVYFDDNDLYKTKVFAPEQGSTTGGKKAGGEFLSLAYVGSYDKNSVAHQDVQECIDYFEPDKYPNATLPVALSLDFSEPHFHLRRWMNQEINCSENSMSHLAGSWAGGTLSAAAIQRSQASIDWEVYDADGNTGQWKRYAPLPVYDRISQGGPVVKIWAYSKTFGPAKVFRLQVKTLDTEDSEWANTYQEETWQFFEGRLVQHSGEVRNIRTKANSQFYTRYLDGKTISYWPGACSAGNCSKEFGEAYRLAHTGAAEAEAEALRLMELMTL